ncbi:MAG: sodium-dependent transporter [Bacillota bacterium]|nr:sodium-dependent transporter [Bacillota bacterium]
MENSRGNWGSNIGFLLAAIGSAVGLGNIWGFPYKMGKNGGFAFLIIYLILAVLVGFVIMIAEISLGRKTGKGAFGTYKELAKGFKWVGAMAVIVPLLIMTFYSVLGAYCMEYMFVNLGDLAFHTLNMSGGDLFGAMLTNPFGCIVYTFLFMALCFLIVKGGIKDGIEKFNVVGMPTLAIMLVIVIIRSVTLPGASEGLKFMFAPNFEPLKENFIGVLSVAGGQMFFSLSLAMGIMITYGSYLSKKENIVRNTGIIVLSDTIVAIMAGLAVLPAAFALGGEDAAMSGPKLLFITLQDVFASMGQIGPIFGTIFYLLVLIAAMTSAISLTEVIATMYVDRCAEKGKEPNRMKATAVICVIIFLGASVIAADGLGSNGMWVPFQNSLGVVGSFNDCWLDFVDFIAEGLLMPLGALLMSIIVGWIIGPDKVKEEVEINGTHKFAAYGFFKFCIKFFVPVAMAFILVGQVDGFLGLGIFS